MTLKKTLLVAAALPMVAGGAHAQDLVLGVPNWPAANATSNILKIVIEENFGLEVELQNGTNPIIFEAMDAGSMHLHPEVWLPNQANLHNTYVQEAGTVVANQNPVQAVQGMCVTQHTADTYGITSIDDLTDPDKIGIFDRDGDGTPEVWIGAPGWASTVIEQVRAKSYGYDQTMDLRQYDGTVAWGELGTAANNDEPWIGFCYEPHFIFVAYDLVYLDEPEHDPDTWNIVQPTDDPNWLELSEASTAWNGAKLHLHYAANIRENYPEVAAMLDNYSMPPEVLSEAGFELSVNDVPVEQFAADWVAANEDIVLGWLTGE
ncbi:ABC transporter substrate-binding protein [Pontivivens insulae]|uniref:Glycine betaine/proline betaine-binding periplasmic protein n=1 Tax=Pontivivens insulae TaxID=1639689 RepID=A0A2R8A9K5_9RHOB|nr:glycine betaine ABC transporter substrate-binding protein [Pontivivens insulae]RED18850.1 glycine betaine/proline transport system substrate-binding protein [Pontivivens insulae]SPF28750.1 Glycine betaine/proline betaine-binding periplasmic protein [Pontivivens insulae]